MAFLRWIKRFLKGLRDRILWILDGIFGPPARALRRVLLTLRDQFDAIVARVLKWWANIWGRAEKDEKESLGKPSIACLLFSSFTLALVMYSWPSWEYLSTRLFIGACVLVWLGTLLVLRRLSYPDSEHRLSPFLREAGERPGLVWWERIGAVASIVLVWFSAATPHLLPLAISVAVAFLRLLITKYQLRELQRMSEPPLTPPPPPEPEQEGDYLDRSFRWTMRAGILVEDNTMSVPIHLPTYERLRAGNPHKLWAADTPRFDLWIVDGSTEDVDRAAFSLQQMTKDRSYSTFAEISNVLAFVQSIQYSLDVDTTPAEDYWRYPVETMHDETGDCEDTTILAAAVLRRLGHRVGTMLMPEHAALAVEAPPGTPGHFIVHDGHPMYYCETTDSGWSVGELPRTVQSSDVKLFMVPQ